MLRVGLTGGIGSGKTTVSDLFEQLNVPVIDTDIIAHQLVENDASILQQITNAFGQEILKLDGQLNRKKLANIVFNRKENKQRLENILHPKIQRTVLDQLQKLASKQHSPAYSIIVVPLLIEARASYQNIIDRILVVMADETHRINRVQHRDQRNLEQINAIIRHQVDDKTRREKADDLINNNGQIKNLEAQVKVLHEKYRHLSTL